MSVSGNQRKIIEIPLSHMWFEFVVKMLSLKLQIIFCVNPSGGNYLDTNIGENYH